MREGALTGRGGVFCTGSLLTSRCRRRDGGFFIPPSFFLKRSPLAAQQPTDRPYAGRAGPGRAGEAANWIICMEMKGGGKGMRTRQARRKELSRSRGIKHGVAYSGIYVTTTTMPVSPLFRLGKIRRNNTGSQAEVNGGGAGGRKRKRPHQLSSNVVALPPEKYGCFIFVFKAVLTKVFGLGVLERANPAISELTDFPIFLLLRHRPHLYISTPTPSV